MIKLRTIPLFSKPTVPYVTQAANILEEIRTKQVQIAVQLDAITNLVHQLDALSRCACGDHFSSENPGVCSVCAEASV